MKAIAGPRNCKRRNGRRPLRGQLGVLLLDGAPRGRACLRFADLPDMVKAERQRRGDSASRYADVLEQLPFAARVFLNERGEHVALRSMRPSAAELDQMHIQLSQGLSFPRAIDLDEDEGEQEEEERGAPAPPLQ